MRTLQKADRERVGKKEGDRMSEDTEPFDGISFDMNIIRERAKPISKKENNMPNTIQILNKLVEIETFLSQKKLLFIPQRHLEAVIQCRDILDYINEHPSHFTETLEEKQCLVWANQLLPIIEEQIPRITVKLGQRVINKRKRNDK